MDWFPNAGKYFAPKLRDAEMDLKTDFDALFETGGEITLTDVGKNSSELCDGFGARRIIASLE